MRQVNSMSGSRYPFWGSASAFAAISNSTKEAALNHQHQHRQLRRAATVPESVPPLRKKSLANAKSYGTFKASTTCPPYKGIGKNA